MNHSKRICDLSAISRGLDITNPEYKRKPRRKVAHRLRRVIASVLVLETKEYEADITLATCRDIACGLVALLDESEFDRVAIKDAVIGLIQCIDGEA